jgi:hypothetical protein
MNTFLPIAIIFCGFIMSRTFLLPRLVERITGRSGSSSSARFRVANVVVAIVCVVLMNTIFGAWPTLWQIAFFSTSLLILLLVTQGVWGTPSGPNPSSKRTREKPRAA